ncbi:hypothetical protein Malapachy_1084 [Malassezia pachydermatis]|uniref:Phosphoglycerate mutase family protein n=1 Tax=Malassezia pachydermatis TaxID=77020 RepID=A0A0M9VQ16_9BASI|nr:hypothetical protein Malapachy_1084 [Malassezia pachydermatis]KOS15039.1 hypothetical protein Malapachy_1084 [Malassezia pachydermatis]
MRGLLVVVALAALCAGFVQSLAVFQFRGHKSIDATIYLIRHGEKVDDDTVGLSLTGKRRAQCIASLFSQGDHKVDAIFAQDFKKSGKRIRPFATVEPLGERLGIEVHHKCDRDDVDCAVDSISKAVDDGAKRVLVCWEHDTLSDIADKLGIKDLEYPDDRFDIVFQLHDGAMQQIYSEGCPSIDVQHTSASHFAR